MVLIFSLGSRALIWCLCLLFVYSFTETPAVRSPRVPVMGWSTWCTEQKCSDYSQMPLDWCSSHEVLSVANSMKESGLLAAGYDHLLLDDCWGIRDSETNRITWVEERFPEGIPWLAKQVHSLGFKFGLYTAVGQHACHWNHPSWPRALNFTGSWPFYAQDAQDFVDWRVDYVKLDDCGPWHGTPRDLVTNFSRALRQSAHAANWTVWLNLGGPFEIPEQQVDESAKNMSCRMADGSWCAAVADSFRVWDDHHDDWKSTNQIIVHGLAADRRPWYASPGLADADFLFVGGQGCGNHSLPGQRCPGQTNVEYTTSFSLWALFSGQLVFASDPRSLSVEQKKTLLNEKILNIVRNHPESLADAISMRQSDAKIVFIRPLRSRGEAMLALFNGANTTGIVVLRWDQIPLMGWGNDTVLQTEDVWSGENGKEKGGLAATVVPHGTVVVWVKET